MMNVVHIHVGRKFGGIQSSLQRIAHATKGTVCNTILSTSRGFVARLQQLGIQAETISLSDGHWVIRRRVRRYSPSVVCVQGLAPLGITTAYPWLLSCPVVTHLRGPVLHSHRRTANYLAANAHIVCNSGFTRSTLLDHYPEIGVPVSVVYNGIDASACDAGVARHAMRRDLEVADDELAVGLVANFWDWKRQDIFIRAAAQRPDKVRFFLIGGHEGGEEYYRRMRELAATLDSPVSFLGHRSDINSILDALDVVALCSDGEAFGNVLIEAMAHRRPCVAADSGACPEVIANGITGLLFPAGDPEALLHAVMQMKDAARRAEMGEAGRQRVESLFSAQRLADGLVSVLGDARRRGGTGMLERGMVASRYVAQKAVRFLRRIGPRWSGGKPLRPEGR